ncbi:hypothetical protein [Nocardiopsis sp. CNR-923]|uniref:hypothetical protein n=1 Tax=Nocardiopsis sp. CNR-923 TaxID=1904965 RepID=UPI000A8548C5|nr:hypothetical protein [Nocardiopsis sp. CNR-923]
MGRADEMSDGAVWLWSGPLGEAVRVNGNNAQIDLVAALPESSGSRVRVSQNDDYLLLFDPVSGRVTSVDLREMGFSGVLDLGAGGDFSLTLGEETAVVIDHEGGEVRAVDPATLQPTGPLLRIPAPLAGGAFDDSDTLWLGVPTQGTVVGVTVQEGEATIEQTVSVADPGADIAVTVLDGGVLTVDRTGETMVAVNGRGEPRVLTSPIPLEGAEVPERTRGDLAAVTLPASGEIVTVRDPGGAGRVGSFSTGREGGGVAVPYEGRLYVPYEDEATVRAFDATGKELNPISLTGAEGPLELETREGNLYINAPDSGVAAVVDPEGQATVIDKTARPPGTGEENEDEEDPTPRDPRPGDVTPPAPNAPRPETPVTTRPRPQRHPTPPRPQTARRRQTARRLPPRSGPRHPLPTPARPTPHGTTRTTRTTSPTPACRRAPRHPSPPRPGTDRSP